MVVKIKRGNSRFTLGMGSLNLSRANRSQITIFVIVGVLIVVSIISFFLLWGNFDFQQGDSKNPEQFIEMVDFVCVGEGEHTLLELLNGESLDKINGLWFKRNNKVIKNGLFQRKNGQFLNIV